MQRYMLLFKTVQYRSSVLYSQYSGGITRQQVIYVMYTVAVAVAVIVAVSGVKRAICTSTRVPPSMVTTLILHRPQWVE
jgi:hypothetical protein